MSLPAKTKSLLIQKFSILGLVAIGGALSITCFMIYVKPWYVKRRHTQAEEHANIIYELQKKRILQQEQNERLLHNRIRELMQLL
ncbi:unnamed protein product [Lasius platythorax]|uniref:Uncharacterized protein n=1 Tax=Lasius platythorax TaxID=488582 RepID=A0AAV2NW17_9HYME